MNQAETKPQETNTATTTTPQNRPEPDFTTYTTAERRAWLLEHVKKHTWFVVRTRGEMKKLTAQFGVDRKNLYNDFQLIAQESAVVDLPLLEMDARHLLNRRIVEAAKMADNEKLPVADRVRAARLVLQGVPALVRTLESFGKKDRDMSPPPLKDERPDERVMDQMAQDYAREWRERNRPKKPDGVK